MWRPWVHVTLELMLRFGNAFPTFVCSTCSIAANWKATSGNWKAFYENWIALYMFLSFRKRCSFAHGSPGASVVAFICRSSAFTFVLLCNGKLDQQWKGFKFNHGINFKYAYCMRVGLNMFHSLNPRTKRILAVTLTTTRLSVWLHVTQCLIDVVCVCVCVWCVCVQGYRDTHLSAQTTPTSVRCFHSPGLHQEDEEVKLICRLYHHHKSGTLTSVLLQELC